MDCSASAPACYSASASRLAATLLRRAWPQLPNLQSTPAFRTSRITRQGLATCAAA